MVMDSFQYSDSTSSISSEDVDTVSSAGWDSIDGPLYDMDSLKAHLPCKGGLSKFFVGKSQSFTSLADVKSLEDLAKPQNSYKRKKSSSSRCCNESFRPRILCGSISKRPHKSSFGSKMAKKGIEMSQG